MNGTDTVSCWSLKHLQQKAKEKEQDLHSGGVIKWVHYYPGGLWGLVRPNWCRRNSYAMPALPCKAVLFDPFGQPCGQGVDASTFCLLLEGKVSTVCLIVWGILVILVMLQIWLEKNWKQLSVCFECISDMGCPKWLTNTCSHFRYMSSLRSSQEDAELKFGRNFHFLSKV